MGNSRSGTKESAIRSEAQAPARAYAIRAREDVATPDVIVVCKYCPLKIWNCDFLADLMLLPFDEFDVILSMDWLTLHDAFVNYRRKHIVLKCQNSETGRVDSDRFDSATNIITALIARKCLESILTVCDFADIFPEKLPGLPPVREVEFVIKSIPGTSMILIASYRMTLAELRHYKSCQIEDLFGLAFLLRVRLFYFVKKKDGSMRLCIDYRKLYKVTIKNKYPCLILMIYLIS
ncbi:Transposon Ty3-G Gag-Pol polyprotein [Gossypium australe]|uniref:Transposon Ty3-G Gag-Pol polyprotein n=1 Tax=Gossypium australe TaxID=47621 RepID=A0A5B6WPV3_9ROSI|nr:Transposon Ty3-G Gag-Pol polyprotein [Gossypium australe]